MPQHHAMFELVQHHGTTPHLRGSYPLKYGVQCSYMVLNMLKAPLDICENQV